MNCFQLIKYKNLPLSETAHYRLRWKREVLAGNGSRFVNGDKVKAAADARFFSKAFQKEFLKPGKTPCLLKPCLFVGLFVRHPGRQTNLNPGRGYPCKTRVLPCVL
jgi:hypothetical protein